MSNSDPSRNVIPGGVSGSTLENLMGFLALAHRLVADAAKAGVSPWEHFKNTDITSMGSNDTRLKMTSAATVAEVIDIYQSLAEDQRSFSKAFYTKAAGAFIRDLSRNLNYEGAAGQFTVNYHTVAYEDHGKHHYKVSDGLATLLALTELRGLKVDDLKLPFQSIFIEIPACLGFRIFNREMGWQPAEGVFIHEDRFDDSTTKGEINLGRSWRILAVSRSYQTEFGTDSAQAFFSLPLVEGDTVDDAVERLRTRTAQQGITDPDGDEVNAWVGIWRWIMNVIVYATTPDAEADHVRGNEDAEAIWRRVSKLPKVSAKRDRLKDRLKGMDSKWRTVLGKSVVLTPALREMREHQQSTGTGKALRVRTLVSGHWMRFAVGEGRKERTWKFRQPFWRGPDGAPTAPTTDHVLAE